MPEPWRPLGAGDDHFDSLYEGIPPWLGDALWEWIESAISPDGRRADFSYVQQFEILTRSMNPKAREAESSGGIYVLRRDWDDETTLQFVDYLVHRNEGDWQEGNGLLEGLLQDGGSAWRVGRRSGYAGLEARVPTGVVDVAEGVMRAAGDAGKRLSEAWAALYGRNPDYSRAYSEAVKAVEDAALKAVIPRDAHGTLGKAIAAMRAQGDWVLSVPREHADHPSGAVVLGMMQALWTGQTDRHGGTASTAVDKASAEVAIGLATALVLWFHAGLVSRPGAARG